MRRLILAGCGGLLLIVVSAAVGAAFQDDAPRQLACALD
jgi:hypothetical protein